MRSQAVIFALLFSGACSPNSSGSNSNQNSLASVVPSRPIQQPSAVHAQQAPPQPPAPARNTTVGSLSVATFKGDDAIECTTTTVQAESAVDYAPQSEVLMRPEQLALILMDDALAAFEGGPSKSSLGDRTKVMKLALFLLNETGSWPAANKTSKSDDEKMVANSRVLAAAATWPLEMWKKEIAAGTLVRVRSCELPGVASVATCTMPSDRTDNDKFPVDVRWEVARTVFDATSIPHALKRCLQLDGTWTTESQAPNTVSTTAAVAEDPRARVQQLEIQALQTQAVHMRAVAAHEANADCRTFEDCVAKIPAMRDLQPGQYAQRMKACIAQKSENCKATEAALERARSENIAVRAELEAARGSLSH